MLLLLLLAVATERAGGSSGHALLFDTRRADVLMFQWPSTPLSNLTVEWWIKVIDPTRNGKCILSYGTYDGTTDPVYSSPYELFFLTSPSYGFYMAKSLATTFLCSSACRTVSSWTRYSIVWEQESGRVQVFVNGQRVLETFELGSDNRKPIVPNGVAYVGQGFQDFPLTFGPTSAFDGLLDEFKIWNRSVSVEEIQSENASSTDLLVYYNFDQVGDTVPNLAGSPAQDGRLGRVDGSVQKMVFSGQPTVPTKPRYVVSDAPLSGAEVVLVDAPSPYLFSSFPHQNFTTLEVPSDWRILLDSVPVQINQSTQVGTVEVETFLPVTSKVQVWRTTSFTYHFVARTVTVPRNLTFHTQENQDFRLTLAQVQQDGSFTEVHLLTVPERGTLLRGSQTLSTAPMILTDLAEVVFRNVPFSYSDPEVYASFVYSFGGQENATVSFVVVHVNSPSEPSSLVISDNISGLIQLSSFDPDNATRGDFYRITSWPRFGTLSESSFRADLSSPSEITFTYATRVLNASSQFSFCSDCSLPWLCNCTNTKYHATQILGPPDLYPAGGDLAQAWDPDNNDNLVEFIEVELGTSMFVESISIYETFTPGAVFRVSFAPDLSGNWTVFWERPAERERVAAPTREFSPRLCPILLRVSYLRLDLVHAGIVSALDAVKVTGYPMPPRGLLRGSQVQYRPFDGVSSEDEFSYATSDCEAWSPVPATVTVGAQSSSTTVAATLSFEVPVQNATLLNLTGLVDEARYGPLESLHFEHPGLNTSSVQAELTLFVSDPLQRIANYSVTLVYASGVNVSYNLELTPVCMVHYLLENQGCVPCDSVDTSLFPEALVRTQCPVSRTDQILRSVVCTVLIAYSVILPLSTLVVVWRDRSIRRYTSPLTPWPLVFLPNAGLVIMLYVPLGLVVSVSVAAKQALLQTCLVLVVGVYTVEGVRQTLLQEMYTMKRLLVKPRVVVGRRVVIGEDEKEVEDNSPQQKEDARRQASMHKMLLYRSLVSSDHTMLALVGVSGLCGLLFGFVSSPWVTFACFGMFWAANVLLVLPKAEGINDHRMERFWFVLYSGFLVGLYVGLLTIPLTFLDFLLWGLVALFQWRHYGRITTRISSEPSTPVRAMLRSDDGFSYLLHFCKGDGAEELLQCWRSIQNFRGGPSKDGLSLFFAMYLDESAPFLVDAPSAILRKADSLRQTKISSHILYDSESVPFGSVQDLLRDYHQKKEHILSDKELISLLDEVHRAGFHEIWTVRGVKNQSIQNRIDAMEETSRDNKLWLGRALFPHSYEALFLAELKVCLDPLERHVEEVIEAQIYPRFLMSSLERAYREKNKDKVPIVSSSLDETMESSRKHTRQKRPTVELSSIEDVYVE